MNDKKLYESVRHSDPRNVAIALLNEQIDLIRYKERTVLRQNNLDEYEKFHAVYIELLRMKD